MNFKEYLVTTTFVILLLWGPNDHSWPLRLAIRAGYLILIPLLVGLLLSWLWNYYSPSNKVEDALGRILSGLICLFLVTLAVQEATSITHIANTHYVRTRDELIPVGDDIVARGPDYGSLFLLIVTALLFLVIGVLRKGNDTNNS